MKATQILLAAMALEAILYPGCCKRPSQPPAAKSGDVVVDFDPAVKVGTKRANVLQAIGEPAEKTEIVKRAEPIFGVIEAWWAALKDGDKVEIWRYPRSEGTFEVYFLNQGKVVWHTAFVGKNVVF